MLKYDLGVGNSEFISKTKNSGNSQGKYVLEIKFHVIVKTYSLRIFGYICIFRTQSDINNKNKLHTYETSMQITDVKDNEYKFAMRVPYGLKKQIIFV